MPFLLVGVIFCRLRRRVSFHRRRFSAYCRTSVRPRPSGDSATDGSSVSDLSGEDLPDGQHRVSEKRGGLHSVSVRRVSGLSDGAEGEFCELARRNRRWVSAEVSLCVQSVGCTSERKYL